jgi:hypothetical protein
MVTFQQFAKMDLPHRSACLMNYGTWLSVMKAETGGRSLYAIGDFYAEMYYDHENNQILTIVPFRRTIHLEDWLQRIDLEELLNQ